MENVASIAKKSLSGVLRLLAALTLVAIPLGFILSGSVITKALDSVLRLKVSPGFTGGREAAVFHDPPGDDRGAGSLTYPSGDRFAESGCLDIVKYVVYEPVVKGQWSSDDSWQLGVFLAAMPNPDRLASGFSVPAIRIYVDTDGAASGSIETARPRSELVTFDPAFPWDLCVEIDGWRTNALLRTAGGVERELETIAVPERSAVWVRLPLDLPEVKRALDGRPTRHYVMTLASDPLLASGVMPVREEASQAAGGGASSSLVPRVYDVLATDPSAQARMLGSWDEATYAFAVLSPVSTSDPAPAAGAVDLEALAREAADADAEAGRRARAEAEAALLAAADDLSRGIALFELGRHEEAKAAFSAALRAATPDTMDYALALAYSGSLVAMEGGKSGNPADAIRFVNEAFVSLDAAVELARGLYAEDPSLADACVRALLNRASVAAAVPNEVFSKATVAAEDFAAAAEISMKAGNGSRAADLWLAAALALETAGANAEIAFMRAAACPDASPRVRFELAKRGYLR